MNKHTLIQNMSSRIGIKSLDKFIPEIDYLITHAIRFYNRYKPLEAQGSTTGEVVNGNYTFTDSIPSDIITVLNTDSGDYCTDFIYYKPVIQNLIDGNYLFVFYTKYTSLDQYSELPDLLDDLILGSFSTAVKTKMAATSIPIEITVDGSVLDVFIEMGNAAKEEIIIQKDYRLCLR